MEMPALVDMGKDNSHWTKAPPAIAEYVENHPATKFAIRKSDRPELPLAQICSRLWLERIDHFSLTMSFPDEATATAGARRC